MGEDIILALWKTSWQAAILCGIVFILSRFMKNAPASFKCWLWLIVLIKFFVPPFVHVPASYIIHEYEPAVSMNTVPLSVSAPVDPVPAPPVSGEPVSVATADVHRFDMPDEKAVLLWLWFGGIGFYGLRLLVRTVRLRRLTSDASVPGEEIMSMVFECARTLGVRRLPRVAATKNISTPTLTGLFRPTILIPEDISRVCSRSDLMAMLMHELAHVKRLDNAAAWFQQLAQVFFFFHPAVWLAGKELRRERELACDEMVLSKGNVSRREYASGYLSAVRMANHLHYSDCMLTMSEPLEIEKRRLRMILRKRIPRMSPGLMAIVFLVVAIGLPTIAGVKSKPSAEIPDNDKDLLLYVLNGTHDAATAIESCRGNVTVHDWSRKNSKSSIEYMTVYDAAISGDRYRLEIDSTVIKNDLLPEEKDLIPVEPGFQEHREVASDGHSITNLVSMGQTGRYMATIGKGKSIPSSSGGVIKDVFPAGDRNRYIRNISLSGLGLPGNGIIDLIGIKKNFGEDSVKVVGREVVDGSTCAVVKMKLRMEKQYYKLWVDLSRGFIISRFEFYSFNEKTGKQWLAQEMNVDIVEYAPGVWGPSKIVCTSYLLDYKKEAYKHNVKTTVFDSDFRVNVPVSEEDLSLIIPDGAGVYDEASDTVFRWPDVPY